MVGHDKGVHRGDPHGIKLGGGIQPSLSKEAQHGASTRSCHNRTMDRECSDHSSHDNGSTTDGGTVAGYRPPEQHRTR
jgi:hypothetical protein